MAKTLFTSRRLVIISLSIIFLLSLFIRLYRLDQNVPNLFVDEAGGHLSFYQYVTQPNSSIFNRFLGLISSATWIFGLNPLGVRFPSALYGSLLSLAIFAFAYAVSSKKLAISLAAAFLTAILPWSFMISRIGHGHILLMLLAICLHLYLLIRAQKFKDYLFSLIPFLIATYFYPSMVIIAPFAFLLTLYYAQKTLSASARKQFLLISFLVFSTLFILIINRYQVFSFRGRGFELAIWQDINVTADQNLYRGIARHTSPSLFSLGLDTEAVANKLFFNTPVAVISVFVRNYLSFYSPEFLFQRGDTVLRHSTGMVGEFFPFLFPFMLYGAFAFFKEVSAKNRNIFLLWMLLSPVPAAITKDGANYLLRVITLMPFLTYFCSLGLVSVYQHIKNHFFRFIYFLLVVFLTLFSLYYFLFGYFHVYPALSVDSWESGFQDLAAFVRQNQNPNTLVLWENAFVVRNFCFWNQINSTACGDSYPNQKYVIGNSTIYQTLPYLFFSHPSPLDLKEIIRVNHIQYLAIPKRYLKEYQENLGKQIPIITFQSFGIDTFSIFSVSP